MINKAETYRFQVLTEKFGNLQLLKLYNIKTNEFVSILPEMGGMFHSLQLLVGNKLIHVVDYYSNDSELRETLDSGFKGCNLFPFPNRIDGGKFELEGKTYQLPVNFVNENNSIHGLIFKEIFNVIESKSSDNFASVKLKFESKGKFNGYPFPFILEVEFKLEETQGLTISTSFSNSGKQTIPVGNGWHPYFQLSSKVDDLIFSFPAKSIYEVNKRMIPTGKKSEYKTFNQPIALKNTQFDTCFELDNSGEKADITIFDPSLNGGIKIWQETGKQKFNFLQVYTPPSRKTIAIEPMTCIPDAFNNKTGLITLQPGEKIKVEWGVSVLNNF